jgi:hypothetical protein
MSNPTRSCLQHYGYVGSGHYYIAQYFVTASFDPMAMVRSYGCVRFYGSVVPRCPSLWFYSMTSLDPMSSRKCGVQYYGSMDLWYVWSYPMSGYVVCLVLSYAWIYGMCGPSLCLVSGSMVCVVYPASPSTMDLWYVRSYPMSSRPMILIYVWLYPTSPRPAILRYARSILSDVGLRASVWSTQDHTRPPLGGVAPRRAEVSTGGTHTPVFDTTVRSGRGLGATLVCTRGELCGAQAERRRPSSSKRRRGPFRKWESERRRKCIFRPITARGRRRFARQLSANGRPNKW